MKYEKCIVSVLYFVTCFAKTFVKYLRNVKYEKCLAGFRIKCVCATSLVYSAINDSKCLHE